MSEESPSSKIVEENEFIHELDGQLLNQSNEELDGHLLNQSNEESDEQLLNQTNGGLKVLKNQSNGAELQEFSTPEKGYLSQEASPNDLESENSIHVAEETDSLSTNGHLSTNEQFNKVKGDF